jgi:hypothetical protein
MKTFVLLVTWFVSNQPPSSYQTIFNSAEACEAARNAVLAEGRRINAEREGQPLGPVLALSTPTVTAVCAAQ